MLDNTYVRPLSDSPGIGHTGKPTFDMTVIEKKAYDTKVKTYSTMTMAFSHNIIYINLAISNLLHHCFLLYEQ